MNFLEEKIISDGVIKEGNILKVDNFLNHQIDIVKQAGADVVGLGVAIEKGQHRGGKLLREAGYHQESIAIIDDMDFETQTIHFRDNK
mgnify:FL=1